MFPLRMIAACCLRQYIRGGRTSRIHFVVINAQDMSD